MISWGQGSARSGCGFFWGGEGEKEEEVTLFLFFMCLCVSIMKFSFIAYTCIKCNLITDFCTTTKHSHSSQPQLLQPTIPLFLCLMYQSCSSLIWLESITFITVQFTFIKTKFFAAVQTCIGLSTCMIPVWHNSEGRLYDPSMSVFT